MKNIIHVITFPFILINYLNGSIIISQYIETNSGTTPKGIELWNGLEQLLIFQPQILVIKKALGAGAPIVDYTLSSGTLINGGVIVVGTSGDLATTTTCNNGVTTLPGVYLLMEMML